MNTTKTDMKKLSEIYNELGVAFSFPIEIEDSNGNNTYHENSTGYWYRRERDAKGNVTYYVDSHDYWCKKEYDAKGDVTYHEASDGYKRGTPRSAKTCEGKCWRDASELELEQKQRIKELEDAVYKVRSLAEYGEGDHQAAPDCCADITKIVYDV